MTLTIYKRRIIALISSGYRFLINEGTAKGGLRILLYHAVGTRLPHDTYGISVTRQAFLNQMDALNMDKRVDIVSLNALMDRSLWRHNDGRLKVAITFDDGYRDVLRVAAPILLGHGFPFTVFVTAGFVGRNASLYLDAKELQTLSNLAGVSIGAHGMDHRRFTGLDNDHLRNDLVESRATLETITGRKIEMLSYPHGKADLRVRDASVALGYRLGATSRFGVNRENGDPMMLRRTEIWATDSENIFRQKYLGSWDWYCVYQRLRGM